MYCNHWDCSRYECSFEQRQREAMASYKDDRDRVSRAIIAAAKGDESAKAFLNSPERNRK